MVTAESIQITVGIMSDGTVNGSSFLSISETAGLGANCERTMSSQARLQRNQSTGEHIGRNAMYPKMATDGHARSRL
ncbi:MAG: FMN-binding protein [Coprococcus sp.]